MSLVHFLTSFSLICTALVFVIRWASRRGDHAAATDWADRTKAATFVPGDRK